MKIKKKLYTYGTLSEEVSQLFQLWLSEHVEDICEEVMECFSPEDLPVINKYEITVRQINLTDTDKNTIKEWTS